MNEQLDLFEWSTTHSAFTDLGGRCGWCLEYNNWLVVSEDEDYDCSQRIHRTYTELQCQTPNYYDDTLLFAGLCHKTKTVETESDS